jgi:hypothetical protein
MMMLISGILTIIDDNETEVAWSFKYLWNMIINTIDETEEIQARILAANKANYSLKSIFKSKQIH